MKHEKRSWLRIGLFVFLLAVVLARATDADLSDLEILPANSLKATTLDFANQETATGQNKSLLFSLAGLIPGGFQVESVRISNQGKMAFTYQTFVEQTAGNSELCVALNLKVLRNWQSIYDGPLLGLALSSELSEASSEDLVLALSLPAGSGLANNTCGFSLKFKTFDETGLVKFSDEEILQSQVSTGSF